MIEDLTVRHRTIDIDGVETFYREAGSEHAPVVLLPHGYPCSSYEFRDFMPALADRWRLLAPDFPGCGYSATPADFSYDFDGYAAFLERFTAALAATTLRTLSARFRLADRLAPGDPAPGTDRGADRPER